MSVFRFRSPLFVLAQEVHDVYEIRKRAEGVVAFLEHRAIGHTLL